MKQRPPGGGRGPGGRGGKSAAAIAGAGLLPFACNVHQKKGPVVAPVLVSLAPPCAAGKAGSGAQAGAEG